MKNRKSNTTEMYIPILMKKDHFLDTIQIVWDSQGTNQGFGHNSIKNSSIDLELDIIALPIKCRTGKTLLQKCTYFF